VQKFDAASFILAGEIRNRTKTNKQTNDISTPCLSACVDNKNKKIEKNNLWIAWQCCGTMISQFSHAKGNMYNYKNVVIRLEDRLVSIIGLTLRRVLAVFTRSAITPPKVNRFG